MVKWTTTFILHTGWSPVWNCSLLGVIYFRLLILNKVGVSMLWSSILCVIHFHVYVYFFMVEVKDLSDSWHCTFYSTSIKKIDLLNCLPCIFFTPFTFLKYTKYNVILCENPFNSSAWQQHLCAHSSVISPQVWSHLRPGTAPFLWSINNTYLPWIHSLCHWTSKNAQFLIRVLLLQLEF